MDMLKIYGSGMCPDCRECRKNFDTYGIAYEFIDINENLRNLKDFLKMRDSDPIFDRCKEENDIGLPALVKEDETVFLDWENYLSALGYEVLYEEKESCSLDGKGC